VVPAQSSPLWVIRTTAVPDRSAAAAVTTAAFLTAVAEVVRGQLGLGHLVFYGLSMMLVIRFMPEGIWGRVHRLLTRPRRAAADVALGG